MNDQPDQYQGTSVLIVYLDRAGNLPRNEDNQKPSAQVSLELEGQKEVSLIYENSTEPSWQQVFRFVVDDPVREKLYVEITDSGASNERIGWAKISLKNILEAENMELSKKVFVTESEPRGFLLMKFSLKIFTLEKPE